jgi:hypothetical protein
MAATQGFPDDFPGLFALLLTFSTVTVPVMARKPPTTGVPRARYACGAQNPVFLLKAANVYRDIDVH